MKCAFIGGADIIDMNGKKSLCFLSELVRGKGLNFLVVLFCILTCEILVVSFCLGVLEGVLDQGQRGVVHEDGLFVDNQCEQVEVVREN